MTRLTSNTQLSRFYEDGRVNLAGRFAVLGIFAIAMAYLESAVVVYLRLLYYPEGFTVVLKPMPLSIYFIELGREAATIVMLFTVARLSFRSFWLRFSAFLYLFAVWDLFYYLWLYLFIHWPPSLKTWDILFLIPIAWIGPVWSPMVVSLNFVAASAILCNLFKRGIILRPGWFRWGIAILGAAMIVFSYFNRVPALLQGVLPTAYSWQWLVGGLALGWAALGLTLVGDKQRVLHIPIPSDAVKKGGE